MNLSTISLVLVVAIVVSLLKPFLELGIKPANPLHDNTIRLFAIVVGIVGAAVDYAAHGGNWANGTAVETMAGTGLAAGMGAVVMYHLLTGNGVFDELGAIQGVATPLTPLQTTTAVTQTGTTPAAPVPVPSVPPAPTPAPTPTPATP